MSMRRTPYRITHILPGKVNNAGHASGPDSEQQPPKSFELCRAKSL
ncbi:MAG: hypothetical protein WB037_23570 [Pseudolabrys sp.]